MQEKEKFAVIFDFDQTLTGLHTHNAVIGSLIDDKEISAKDAAGKVIAKIRDSIKNPKPESGFVQTTFHSFKPQLINNPAETIEIFREICNKGGTIGVATRNEFPQIVQCVLDILAEKSGIAAIKDIPVIYGGMDDRHANIADARFSAFSETDRKTNWHRLTKQEAGPDKGPDATGKNRYHEKFKNISGLQSLDNKNIVLVDDSADNIAKATEAGYAGIKVPLKVHVGDIDYLTEVGRFINAKSEGLEYTPPATPKSTPKGQRRKESPNPSPYPSPASMKRADAARSQVNSPAIGSFQLGASGIFSLPPSPTPSRFPSPAPKKRSAAADNQITSYVSISLPKSQIRPSALGASGSFAIPSPTPSQPPSSAPLFVPTPTFAPLDYTHMMSMILNPRAIPIPTIPAQTKTPAVPNAEPAIEPKTTRTWAERAEDPSDSHAQAAKRSKMDPRTPQ